MVDFLGAALLAIDDVVELLELDGGYLGRRHDWNGLLEDEK
jgi:hypothetical protein